jgi:hypothetical protein
MAAMAASAMAWRRSAQLPRASVYGTYWANTLMTWAPGGATEGS